MLERQRISRADYASLKANLAEQVQLRLRQLNLTASMVQQQTADAAMRQEQEASISMADLHHYKMGVSVPTGPKLKALAAVLKCQTTQLVPLKYQTGKLNVARRRGSHPEYPSDTAHSMHVTELPNLPGYAQVKATLVLPTAKAYAVVAALVKQHNIEEARRMGKSEEEIKALMNTQHPGHVAS